MPPFESPMAAVLHRKEIIMKINRLMFRSALIIGLACICLLPVSRVRAAPGAPGQTPAILQNGFDAWSKKRDASWAFDAWKIGGLLEQDSKPVTLSRYFAQLDQILGHYQSYEVIETKRVTQNSEVIYLSVNFAHAVMFGRFLLYQTDKDWVVQNMDFSPKPEAIMPWLAFEGGTYAQ
jgi:hypothetical protein